MTYALYLLSQYPECQERLRQEVKEIKAKHGDLTYEALKEMTYMEACVNGIYISLSYKKNYLSVCLLISNLASLT
jgi:hypothetical protein